MVPRNSSRGSDSWPHVLQALTPRPRYGLALGVPIARRLQPFLALFNLFVSHFIHQRRITTIIAKT